MKSTTIKRKTISGIIISLLILILVFVGASTATYAWYSAINRAIGDSITFTSSAHDEMSGDLAIGWTKSSNLSELVFDKPHSSLYPMIPKNQAIIGTSTYNEFVSSNFNYSAQSFDNELHAWICSFAGQNTTPLTCTGTEESKVYNYFYLINKKTSDKQTINIKYVINGDLAPFLRIALFIGDTRTSNTDVQDRAGMTLYGILSNTDTIHYSSINEKDIVTDTPVMNNVHKASSSISFVINENSAKAIALVAWLDGVMIENQDAEKNTSFNITFDGVLGDIT